MEYIAYNTTLNIKTLIKEKKTDIQSAKDEEQRIFDANKKKLLPFVLTYIHYCVEVHNSIVLKNACGYVNTRAINGLDNAPKLNLQKTLEEYTKDCFYSDMGSTWKCHMFHFKTVNTPQIWLNNPIGTSKFVATPHLEYSMTGGDNQHSPYSKSIEDYIERHTKLWLSMERR